MFKRIGLNRNLAIISITIFTNLFARYTYYALLPLHLRALGATDLEIGISFTAMNLAHNLLSIVGGALADRYGRKVLIAIATFAMGPFFVLAGSSSDWLAVAAMLAGVEIFGALQWPPLSAFIAESSDPDRVARSYSFTESAVLLGLILGPIAGATLINAFSIPTLMIFNGIVLMLNGVARALGLREPTRHSIGSALPKLRAAIDVNVAWFIAVGILVVTSFGIVYGPFFAILARDAWHNDDATINLLWSAGSIASLVGILLGRLSDHWGGKRVFVISAVGFGLTTIVWGIAPTWEWGLVPLLGSFFFSEAMFMAQQTIQAAITFPETRSSVIGVISTITGLVGASGPTLGARLTTMGGNPMPFIAAGVMGLLTAGAVIPIRARKSVSEKTDKETR